ncbi:MAG: class I SAM-dependent methyltransferase [Burkholderiales bacterium]|nr:class I SAM-dependent methyltransferase [Burkholderiales bacterium]
MSQKANHSIDFFDQQFQHQVRAEDYMLNPFECAALPHLRGRVLDLGCGMGNLAVAAARKGRSVLALDGSNTAIAHLKQRADRDSLDIDARCVDLSSFALNESFDTIVCIGLLMFFDRATAHKSLAQIQQRTQAGGIAIVNALVVGTTYLDMFDAGHHYLFGRDEIESQFRHWQILEATHQSFDALNDHLKVFTTVVARKPTG